MKLFLFSLISIVVSTCRAAVPAWLLLLASVAVRAAVPTLQSFEPTQFDTNLNRVKYLAVWTNEASVIHPAQVNAEVTLTNLNLYETFVMPAKVSLLTLGTNELDVSTNSTWLLYSPTNDATQVILSLSAGKFQGQLLFITSQNSDGAFTLPDLSEQFDTPGAYVDLQGDWIGTTNRGLILQYSAPDWIEMDRADPGSTNGPFGGGGTTINPTDGYVPYRLNSGAFGDSPWYRMSALTSAHVNGGTPQLTISSNGAVMIGAGASNYWGGLPVSGESLISVRQPSLGEQDWNELFLGVTASGSSSPEGYLSVQIETNNAFLTVATGVSPLREVQLNAGSSDAATYILVSGTSSGIGIDPSAITFNPGGVYTDDGSQLLRNGVPIGGGSPLWASSSGNLFPSPAVDVVSIESQSADAKTNIAFRVNTTTYWAPTGAGPQDPTDRSNLGEFANAGTNHMIISRDGGIAIGAHVLDLLYPPIDGSVFLAAQDVSLGDPDITELYFLVKSAVGDDLGSIDQWARDTDAGFEIRSKRNGNNNKIYSYVTEDRAELLLQVAGLNRTQLFPSNGDGLTPYVLDTVAHSSGNLLEVQNDTANKFTLSSAGNGFFAGTVSVGSLTNTFVRIGSGMAYTNTAVNATGGFYISDGQGYLRAYMGASPGQAHLFASDGSGVVLANNIFGAEGGILMNLGQSTSTNNNFIDGVFNRNLYVGVPSSGTVAGRVVWNGTTNSVIDTWGSGSPESVVPAGPGSMYRDVLNGEVYIKNTGTGNTGWKLVTHAMLPLVMVTRRARRLLRTAWNRFKRSELAVWCIHAFFGGAT